MVNTLKWWLWVPGFDLRRVRKQRRRYFILMTPKKKARKAVKQGRDIIAGGEQPRTEAVKQINATLWVGHLF